MNRYYLRFLLRRDGRFYKIPAAGLILLPVLQLALFGVQLGRAYNRLYAGSYPGKALSGELAVPLSQLIDQSGGFFIFNIAVVSLTLSAMIPAFCWDTRDGKNLYTQMRLPFSRLHYYGVRLLLPAGMLLLLWCEEMLILLLCRGLYLGTIPAQCLPEGSTLWQSALCRTWYPAAEPGHFPAAVSVLLLLPATVILSAFSLRGRDPLCILAALLGAGALAMFFGGVTLSAGLPVITAAALLWGGYAICHRNTF